MDGCNEFWIWVSNLNISDSISEFGDFLTGIGTIALAWTAYRTLPKSAHEYKEAKQIGLSAQREREESVKFQNKLQLAKDSIRIFNHVKNDIQQIRSPFGFEGELNRLKDLPEDNDLIPKMKKNTSAGLTLLRLNERSASLAEMNRLEPEFRAIFGETDAFDKIRKARHNVWVAATMLADGGKVKDYSKIIWWAGADQKDEIAETVDQSVHQIESICKPVLSGE